MAEETKVFENRMRRAVARQGYRLSKSRVRDPRAADFRRYYIVDPHRNQIIAGANSRMMIEDVERWVMGPGAGAHDLPYRTEELSKARTEVAERYKDKLVFTEEELREQINRLMRPSDRRIAQLEKQLETANARRQQAQDEIARLRDGLRTGSAKAKPFDSNLSLKALSVQQAIEHLRQELKLSPADCIAIEQEMATRIHQRPVLADEKLARMAVSIADIMPWFEKFLELRSEVKG